MKNNLANELRIGNWVTGEDGKAISIYAIDEDGVNGCVNPNDGLEILYNAAEPIPLTEDWLVKFGFEKRFGNEFWKNNMEFDINTIGKVRFHWSQKVTYVDSVHQLQNLYFALTGTELNFKEK